MKEKKTPVTYPYDGSVIRQCSKCPAEIFFVTNPKTGKPMPVNLKTLTSHYIDCPAAAAFRKAEKKK